MNIYERRTIAIEKIEEILKQEEWNYQVNWDTSKICIYPSQNRKFILNIYEELSTLELWDRYGQIRDYLKRLMSVEG